jgi:serine/threonine protein kinase
MRLCFLLLFFIALFCPSGADSAFLSQLHPETLEVLDIDYMSNSFTVLSEKKANGLRLNIERKDSQDRIDIYNRNPVYHSGLSPYCPFTTLDDKDQLFLINLYKANGFFVRAVQVKNLNAGGKDSIATYRITATSHDDDIGEFVPDLFCKEIYPYDYPLSEAKRVVSITNKFTQYNESTRDSEEKRPMICECIGAYKKSFSFDETGAYYFNIFYTFFPYVNGPTIFDLCQSREALFIGWAGEIGSQIARFHTYHDTEEDINGDAVINLGAHGDLYYTNIMLEYTDENLNKVVLIDYGNSWHERKADDPYTKIHYDIELLFNASRLKAVSNQVSEVSSLNSKHEENNNFFQSHEAINNFFQSMQDAYIKEMKKNGFIVVINPCMEECLSGDPEACLRFISIKKIAPHQNDAV